MHERTVRVTIDSGTIEGFTRDGVHRWRSVPYARPPMGQWRYRAPQPVQPWRGVRYCHGFTYCAPQERKFTMLSVGKYQPTGEDCLTLNVVTPEHYTGEPLPVMFFIHGGGCILGSSATPIYDGAALARRGCIFVSANYRLGALGCFDVSTLATAEHPLDDNLFLRDLVAALKWVRTNIAVFGGDPGSVTIFGESAGAHAVATLLAVPQAKGLFHQAIAESPASGMVRSPDAAARFAKQFAEELGAGRGDGAAALMTARPAELMAALDRVIHGAVVDMPGAFPAGPAAGTEFLPEDPVVAMREGRAHQVPLIVGSNADEGRLFTKFMQLLPTNEAMIERILAHVPAEQRARITAAYPGYPQSADACIKLGGDFAFGTASWEIASAHMRHAPTYAYRYDYAPSVSSHLTVVVAFDPRVTSAAVLPRAYGAAVAAETRWQVFWCDPKAEWDGLQFDPLLAGLPSIAEVAHRNGNRAGQPFLLRSDGAYATEVNAFFASVRMRGVTEGTRRKYALGLATWLGFLDLVSCCWADATADHVDTFKFWRMSDEKNPRRVAGGTVRSGLVAISAFYEWAESRYHVENPVERISVRVGPDQPPVDAYRAAPRTGRDRDVKWLDPGGYARWRDVGLRGLDLSGREARSWRGHCPQRDCSFVDGLYGTGLRLTEWASLLQIELPYDDPSRGFMTAQLAAACAKGGVRRKYWMPRPVLSAALAYGEGERAAAVRRAQAAGRYERVADRKILQRQLGGRRVQLRDMQGQLSSVSLDVLDPRARLRIFRESKSGLEPVALWLNEDGIPRAPHGWQHTFVAANKRVTRASLIGLAATAHMLRHSFALRWFSVGRLLYEKRFAHLNAEEMRDFRAQFGDTWYFVMTLLGHRSVATTMNVYLEPFRDLDVELLIEHAHGAAMQGLLAEMFATHPLVTTDPLASGSQS